MKTITIAEAMLTLQAIEVVKEKLKNPHLFEVTKVQKTLQDSIELARPFVTGEEKKDQWLTAAKTLPFEPLVFSETFKGLRKITPEVFLALKRICE
jgi:hypothetical protein